MIQNAEIHPVVIIGAGPYGLSIAAHLRHLGIEPVVIGRVMEFWKTQMPEGMCLRSSWDASHIAAPDDQFTLNDYQAARRVSVSKPIPLSDFTDYGAWFQNQAVPEVIPAYVQRVEAFPNGFGLTLDTGASLRARNVIVATGIAYFAYSPPQFASVSPKIISHASQHSTLKGFAGKHVMVIGGGQSALESAALLREAGAKPEVLARSQKMHWLDQHLAWLKSPSNPLKPVFYPSTDVGPPGFNLLVAHPMLFKKLPREWQDKIAHRSIRPAGAGWLISRLAGVPIHTGREVRCITEVDGRASVLLDDASDRYTDHILLCTGYRVDVAKYPFLTPELRCNLKLVNGYPVLNSGFESSVAGLYFAGAPAAYSFGPLCRFVSGTKFTARRLSRHLRRELN